MLWVLNEAGDIMLAVLIWLTLEDIGSEVDKLTDSRDAMLTVWLVACTDWLDSLLGVDCIPCVAVSGVSPIEVSNAVTSVCTV